MDRRVLLVGLGHRGRDWARQLSDAPGWVVSGAVDPGADAPRAAAELGLQHFQSMDDAWRKQHDAVLIASAAEHHLEPALGAIAQGKPVLIEKPTALRLDDAKQIVASAEAAGVIAMAAQNYRYMRSHRTVKHLLDQRAVGRVGQVVAHYYRSPHEMAPSLRAMEHPVLWGVAVHHLDALRHVLGKDARSVSARMSTHPWTDLEHGASMSALMDFDDDIRVTYTSSYESRGHEYFGGGQEFYQRVVGDESTLHVFHRWLFVCKGKSLPRPIRRGKREVSEERVLLDQFSHAISTGDEPECSMRDNLGTVALLEACLKSAQQRRWVDVAI